MSRPDGAAAPRAVRRPALRHLLRAARAARVPPSPASVSPTALDGAVVVANDTAGTELARALAEAGIPTTITVPDEGTAERVRHRVGRLADASRAGRVARVDVVTGYAALPPALFAIDAASDDMATAGVTLAALERALPAHAVLASACAHLCVDELATGMADPSRLLGLHLAAPAQRTRLVEIVCGAAGGATALATGFALAARLGRVAVRARAGSIGERLASRGLETVDALLMSGSTPWDIDAAMIEFGYALGPHEAEDLVGLDVARAERKRRAATPGPARRHAPIADRMVEEGRLGRKVSVGWYRYPGGEGPIVDPLVEDLAAEEAYFAKVTRRELGAEDIRTRLLCAMIDEACALLDEGTASSAADIDLVTVHGHGFPRRRGGLMHYAERLGAAWVLDRLRAFAREDPGVRAPAAGLERVAASGGRFAELARDVSA